MIFFTQWDVKVLESHFPGEGLRTCKMTLGRSVLSEFSGDQMIFVMKNGQGHSFAFAFCSKNEDSHQDYFR